MAKIPEHLKTTALTQKLRAAGLPLLHQGKVRDTFELPDPDLLLMLASDRISVFDFVLGSLIPGKGKVLTDLTVKWLLGPLAFSWHHLAAWEKGVDFYLPEVLKNDPRLHELHERAIVVSRLQMANYEAIARGYITGSLFSAYKEQAASADSKSPVLVWGCSFPPNLKNGDQLHRPVFTPTTKAEEGHDEHIDFETFRKQIGPRPELMTLQLYEAGYKYAAKRGLILADTKFEFSQNLRLGDEVLTPDSSRYWSFEAYQKREPGKLPPALDKQFVRDFVATLKPPSHFKDKHGNPAQKVNDLQPENDEHADWVAEVTAKLPQEVIERTVEIYESLPRILFG